MAYENILIASLPVIVIIIIVAVRRVRKMNQRSKVSKSPGSFGRIHGLTNPHSLDDTQFYACPHCGGNISIRNNKQFCSNCNQLL